MESKLEELFAKINTFRGTNSYYDDIGYLARSVFELGKEEGARPTVKLVITIPGATWAENGVIILSQNKNLSFRFCFPGGGVDFDTLESLVEALIREFLEELKVVQGTVRFDTLSFLGAWLVPTKRDQWKQKLMFTFHCFATSDVVITPNINGEGAPDSVYIINYNDVYALLKEHPQKRKRAKFISEAIERATLITKLRAA